MFSPLILIPFDMQICIYEIYSNDDVMLCSPSLLIPSWLRAPPPSPTLPTNRGSEEWVGEGCPILIILERIPSCLEGSDWKVAATKRWILQRLRHC